MANKPFKRTTIRLHPQMEKDMKRLANQRAETFSDMLRRYIRDGMARDGWVATPVPVSPSVLE